MQILAAWVYVFLSLVIMLFQLALALGLPWGVAAMGGRFPGKWPGRMRIVAVFNILVLAFLAWICLISAGLMSLEFVNMADYLIWLVVSFSALAVILNTITPSKIERIWAPVAAVQLACSLVLALN